MKRRIAISGLLMAGGILAVMAQPPGRQPGGPPQGGPPQGNPPQGDPAQGGPPQGDPAQGGRFGGPPGGPPGGRFGGPPGGGFGPPGGTVRQLVAEFDKNGDGWLNAEERKPAREEAKKGGGRVRGGPPGGPGGGPGGRGPGGPGDGPGGPGGRGPGGFGPPDGFGPPGGFGPPDGFGPPGRGGPGGGRGGPPGGPGGQRGEPGKPGPRVSQADAKTYPSAELYDPTVLRTLFLEFENPDWEAELQDFHGTDVEVPANLTVDGKTYPNVGVKFRGMSSYGMVPAGSKRSFNVSLDMADPKQRLYGYKALNLLNSHGDASMMSTVLYSHIARQYTPTPKANFVKVVVNGESWGVYPSVQQFDKVFLKENYGTDKGTRWKVSGSPNAAGGLDYAGDRIDDYKRRYEIKGGDDDKAWKALITLCKTLSQTPPDKLEEALTPILDIDGVLRFLALDVALINNDGYWVRASDYSLYRDPKGVFHVIPHDMNEAFHPGMGPGMGGPGMGGPGGRPGIGGPGGGGGLTLDPLVGLDDARKPLRSKLLAVPSLRAKYLGYVKEIADKSLDWKSLGPVVARYRALIEGEVAADTRKLEPTSAFISATTDTADTNRGERGRGMPLRAFADGRRKYLMEYTEAKTR